MTRFIPGLFGHFQEWHDVDERIDRRSPHPRRSASAIRRRAQEGRRWQ